MRPHELSLRHIAEASSVHAVKHIIQLLLAVCLIFALTIRVVPTLLTNRFTLLLFFFHNVLLLDYNLEKI